jgi:glycosyltransferase involved in cell wall biosynthesis
VFADGFIPAARKYKAVKVLVLHNRYQQRGGEDVVVDAEVALLRAHGHDVELFLRENIRIDGMSQPRVALGALWARDSASDLAERISAFRPDIIHAHNTFPLISPSALWVAGEHAVPVVQTLHNFRLICPQAMLLRNGKVCESCVGRLPWPALVHGCYRGSRARSAVIAAMVTLHRGLGTWRNRVARYIALNEFCRRKFVEGGLPAQRIVVKPNFVDWPAPDLERPRQGFLFVGRLSPEKGVDVLARAVGLVPEASLRVAGTGPAEAALDGLDGVTRLGALPPSAVFDEMAAARALVLPSIWYENFPRTLVEAFACGLPVIASRIGALAELVEDGRTGLLFEPGDPESLARCLRWALDHPERLREMGRAARAVFEASYTPAANYRRLLAIYDESMAEQAEMAHPRPTT